MNRSQQNIPGLYELYVISKLCYLVLVRFLTKYGGNIYIYIYIYLRTTTYHQIRY